jgi:organic radical activating enzyme
MDLKLPSSTALSNFWDTHRLFLKAASQSKVFLKAVVCQSTLEQDLKEAIKLIQEVNNSLILVLQPNSFENHGTLSNKLERFRNICLENSVIACVVPQMHKIIGVR